MWGVLFAGQAAPADSIPITLPTVVMMLSQVKVELNDATVLTPELRHMGEVLSGLIDLDLRDAVVAYADDYSALGRALIALGLLYGGCTEAPGVAAVCPEFLDLICGAALKFCLEAGQNTIPEQIVARSSTGEGAAENPMFWTTILPLVTYKGHKLFASLGERASSASVPK